jgi:hypothetical protein
VRDDLYPLTATERRAARAGWRAIPIRDRREAGRLADQGLPAPEVAVSLAARRFGEYLLQRNRSNRMPRSAGPIFGLLIAVLGTLCGVAAIALPGGAAVTALGLLSWGQRRCGRLLVAANAPAPDVVHS